MFCALHGRVTVSLASHHCIEQLVLDIKRALSSKHTVSLPFCSPDKALFVFFNYNLRYVLLNWIFFTKKISLAITGIEKLLYICLVFVMCGLQNE